MVEPGNAKALANTVRMVYENRALIGRMGERARQAAWEFDRTVQVQAYRDLFSDVTGLL